MPPRVLANVPFGIALLDDELHFHFANNRFAAMCGVAADELTGRSPRQVIPEFADAIEILYRQAHSGSAGAEQEIAAAGRVFCCGAYPGDAGDTAVFLEDITERKQRERDLQFQAAILENTADAVVALDPAGTVTFWNRGAERMYGIAKRDAVGKPLKDLYSYCWSTPEEERLAFAALEHRGMWSGENIHVLPSGARIHASSTVNRIAPEHGGGMFAVIRDISSAKEAEAVLRDSVARERARAAELQAIMQAVPAAVFIARDAEGRDMVGNRMSYELLRMPNGSNVSRTAPEGARPDHFRAMKNGLEIPPDDLPVQLAARTGREVHGYEFDLVFDSGECRRWIGNAVPLLDEAGQPNGAVGAFVDLTEERRAEEMMRDAQKLESVGVLAGGIAHEFNNLLIGVIGNASLAQEMLPPGASAPSKLLDDVIANGEQLANLTRQMLAYAGKGRFFVELVDLSALVPQLLKLVRTSVAASVALHLDLATDLPMVLADSGQMQQVFVNLMLNAAEAIDGSAGSIFVRTGVQHLSRDAARLYPSLSTLPEGEYVFLEVRDTGAGMDAATRARIFDPFFTTKFPGRGLGLAAVSGILRGHHGGIVVSSAPGQGSTFRVLFPVAKNA